MTVSYELYTLVNGRWQIHVRYEESRRKEAMTEAQTLEKEPHIERVRVVLMPILSKRISVARRDT